MSLNPFVLLQKEVCKHANDFTLMSGENIKLLSIIINGEEPGTKVRRKTGKGQIPQMQRNIQKGLEKNEIC